MKTKSKFKGKSAAKKLQKQELRLLTSKTID